MGRDGNLDFLEPSQQFRREFVRFADKSSHQLFLEPEGHATEEVYVNGISTSLPRDVQDQMFRLIDGLEHASIMRYGYAVEYDFCQPTQLWSHLESKSVAGLFLAGQINGNRVDPLGKRFHLWLPKRA